MKNPFKLRVLAATLLAATALLFIPDQSADAVYVRGYTRRDGTYVAPHYRSSPDGNPYNNYSFPGNTNPYTGKTATGNPDTYLNNYYNRGSSLGTSSHSSLFPSLGLTYSLPSYGSLYDSYTIPSVLGATTYSDFQNYEVPTVVDEEFRAVYGRKPTLEESVYWKARARSDKQTRVALHDTMQYWFGQGWAGPNSRVDSITGQVLGISTTDQVIANSLVPAIVAQEFKRVFGHHPTKAESNYWKKRARSDKRTVSVLRSAMQWHKVRNKNNG